MMTVVIIKYVYTKTPKKTCLQSSSYVHYTHITIISLMTFMWLLQLCYIVQQLRLMSLCVYLASTQLIGVLLVHVQ